MNITRLINLIKQKQGFTVDKNGNDYKGLGYAVGISKDTEIIVLKDQLSPELIQGIIDLYTRDLDSPNVYLGAWQDQDRVYFDLSEICKTQLEAISKALTRDQIGIYSFEKQKTITV